MPALRMARRKAIHRSGGRATDWAWKHGGPRAPHARARQGPSVLQDCNGPADARRIWWLSREAETMTDSASAGVMSKIECGPISVVRVWASPAYSAVDGDRIDHGLNTGYGSIGVPRHQRCASVSRKIAKCRCGVLRGAF